MQFSAERLLFSLCRRGVDAPSERRGSSVRQSHGAEPWCLPVRGATLGALWGPPWLFVCLRAVPKDTGCAGRGGLPGQDQLLAERLMFRVGVTGLWAIFSPFLQNITIESAIHVNQ